ncbi:hypothetical protein EDD15DRAFT_2193652 [Pisolithus albus]|nr:hypothetical protein EDD15DRAFT_2193652 [Pisolithus albus]
MHPSSVQAGQLGDVPPKQEPDFPEANGIIFRMEETGEWVSSNRLDFSAFVAACAQLTRLKGIVSLPNSSTEAELLLETARAECKLRKIQKQFADQLVRCNLLRLEYSRLQVQRVEQHLLEAEGHVGRAWLVIRRSGYAPGLGGEPSSESERNAQLPTPELSNANNQPTVRSSPVHMFLAFVSNLVRQALQHDEHDWWLKHACPACTYRLQDEPAMRFRMLFAQDGNDSLKRVATRMLDGDIDDADTSLPTSERHSLVDEDGDGNLCAECWKNMKDSATEKMWNVFDESGVFIAVCRHGFCLLIADMVQSGKQSKYALTVTSKLLDAFGPDLGGGYDIGCRFKTTLASSVIGEHNLTTYVEGLGLEDLEGCERAFSKSNALASSTRYASIFHRRQAIAYYFEHSDEMEVYANLTKFLLSNYKQALDILSNGRATLERLMRELGMEYWQWLVNLAASGQALEMILSTWTVVTAQTAAPIWSDSSATRKRETMRRHAQENYEKDLKAVQELEGRLGITRRWVLGDEEWQAASRLVANRKYQRALDNVERLVVSRIFELSKMNQSGTGYKLRKHIGKALQTRSAAIRTALTQFNTAAKNLGRRTLEFDEVVEYAFLADFDLLRDTRQDEEVVRLNVEIRRVVTYLVDEDRYLRACEGLYEDTNPMLAYQISRYRTIRSRFTPLHLRSLEKISRLPGFSGTLAPGISMSRGPGDSASVPQRVHMETVLSSLPVCANDGEEDIDEDADEDHATALEEQCEALQDILSVTMDT